MISGLIDGSEPSQIIILQGYQLVQILHCAHPSDHLAYQDSRILCFTSDSTSQGAYGLFKAHLCSNSKRNETHLILSQFCAEEFLRGLPPDVIQGIKVHEVCDARHQVTDHKKILEGLQGNGDGRVTVFIDSLTEVLLWHPTAYTCSFLHSLANARPNGNCQVVAVLHGDLHDENVLQLLHHTATSIVRLTPPRGQASHAICSTLHKKSTGKIINITEEISLNEKFGLETVSPVREQVAPKQTFEEPAPDPTANLPFNLTLSEKEKSDRSNLILPYTVQRPRVEISSEPNQNSGKIFYQPDDVDDFDEEDPDDDLDI